MLWLNEIPREDWRQCQPKEKVLLLTLQQKILKRKQLIIQNAICPGTCINKNWECSNCLDLSNYNDQGVVKIDTGR